MLAKHLNPNIFNKDVEQQPIRQGFGEGLLIAGRHNENVVALCADLTDSSKISLFKEEFPKRYFEMGIGEQNMASVASGMAAMGKIPFIASYAMFSPGRNWEQIRTTIAYNNVPVKIGGSHAGVSVGPDGGTHQAVEDIALMRVIPRMVVISPCDALEAKKATIAAALTDSPTYIRLAREKTPIITTADSPFEIGKAYVLWSNLNGKLDVKNEIASKKISLIATGALVHKALQAAKELEIENVLCEVINVPTIKPLDEKTILESVTKTELVITIEEHQVVGGLGGAIAELLSEKLPTKIIRIGVQNVFGQSGTPEELIEHYGMGVESIKKAAREI